MNAREWCIRRCMLAVLIVLCNQKYCHVLGDYRRGLHSWMDLLATYTHDPELQVITAPLLISTIHKSPRHPLKFLQPAVSSLAVPWQRFLTVEILQLHALRSSLHKLPYIIDLAAPIVFKVTPRHGPRTNTSFPTVTVLLHSYLFPRERVHRAVAQKRSPFTESPLNSGSTRRSIIACNILCRLSAHWFHQIDTDISRKRAVT
jgi:hypothetical protein